MIVTIMSAVQFKKKLMVCSQDEDQHELSSNTILYSHLNMDHPPSCKLNKNTSVNQTQTMMRPIQVACSPGEG